MVVVVADVVVGIDGSVVVVVGTVVSVGEVVRDVVGGAVVVVPGRVMVVPDGLVVEVVDPLDVATGRGAVPTVIEVVIAGPTEPEDSQVSMEISSSSTPSSIV
jgi:hypothetical protein